jgi:hypothetical protein
MGFAHPRAMKILPGGGRGAGYFAGAVVSVVGPALIVGDRPEDDAGASVPRPVP